MNITAIPDREAAKLLGVTYDTIRNAAKRGDLTRVPQPGLVQHVIREQVELFKGKKRIKFAALSKAERKTWEDASASAKGPTNGLNVSVEDTIKVAHMMSILSMMHDALGLSIPDGLQDIIKKKKSSTSPSDEEVESALAAQALELLEQLDADTIDMQKFAELSKFIRFQTTPEEKTVFIMYFLVPVAIRFREWVTAQRQQKAS
jgi:hypothetical protein